MAQPTIPDGWLGGLREIDIDAPPSVVMDVLADPESYRRALPSVYSLDVIGRGPQGEALTTIVTGNSLFHARYTLHLFRERPDRVHFWLDELLPHDIEGADGFGEITPREGGGSHLAFFVAFDLHGPLRLLVGGKVQSAAMTTPERRRDSAEERARRANP